MRFDLPAGTPLDLLQRGARGEEDLERLAKVLNTTDRFAFDTETTGLDTMTARLVGLSFCTEDDGAWYVPVGHDGLDSSRQLALETVRTALAPALENPAIGKTGQNLKFDIKILARTARAVLARDGAAWVGMAGRIAERWWFAT